MSKFAIGEREMLNDKNMICDRNRKWRVMALAICTFFSMGAMAQELSKDSIIIVRDSVTLSITPQNELSKQSLIKDNSLEDKMRDFDGVVERDRAEGEFIAPESIKRFEASVLPLGVRGSASSGFIVGVHHSLLFSNSRTLSLDYEILKDFSLSMATTLGHSSLPWLQYPMMQYSGHLGFNYNPIASTSLSAGINVGSLLGERYYNPLLSIIYTPNLNWQLSLYGGAYFSTIPYIVQVYNVFYGGVKVKYTTDLGIFVYGKGSISKANMPYNGWSPNALFNGYSSFGGGVGYRNFGVGANYNINPLTGRSRVTYEVSYEL